MLDEHGHESLDGSEDGSVDHDGALERVVVALVLQLESNRQLEIELDRRTLVLALQRVRQLDV